MNQHEGPRQSFEQENKEKVPVAKAEALHALQEWASDTEPIFAVESLLKYHGPASEWLKGQLGQLTYEQIEEMSKADVAKVISFFTKNKVLIVSDLIKGRGILSAGWMLVVQKLGNETRWVLKSINHALNTFSKGDVKVTKPKRGNLKIGQMSMQRKGGDDGRPTAKMLQFKINPLLLFDK